MELPSEVGRHRGFIDHLKAMSAPTIKNSLFIFVAVAWSNAFTEVRAQIGADSSKSLASAVWVLILYTTVTTLTHALHTHLFVVFLLGGHIVGWAMRDLYDEIFMKICPTNYGMRFLVAAVATLVAVTSCQVLRLARAKITPHKHTNHEAAEMDADIFAFAVGWVWVNVHEISILGRAGCESDDDLSGSKEDDYKKSWAYFLSLISIIGISVWTTVVLERRASKFRYASFVKEVLLPLWLLSWSNAVGFMLRDFIEVLTPATHNHESWGYFGNRVLLAVCTTAVCYLGMGLIAMTLAHSHYPVLIDALSEPLQPGSRKMGRLHRRFVRNIILFRSLSLAIGSSWEEAVDILSEHFHFHTAASAVVRVLFAFALTILVALLVVKLGWHSPLGEESVECADRASKVVPSLESLIASTNESEKEVPAPSKTVD